ncbi:VOC family protein [uncultured Pseudacidovorax sp.]|uniref:VOC family protein n=1 Tax=uncultured Pseudacidovorax sp. TaxID=679313 RepID=UPI001B10DF00|nr:VOC family protein [uncultured Pseudacidovorax sp.]MBO9641696.1 VOC family protein [Pseudacidovorax sp.]
MNTTTQTATTTADAPVVRPRRLAHIALRTNRLDDLVAWYCTVLGAHVAHASSKVAFLTYDDEHHRLALIALEDYQPRDDAFRVGHYHTAFAYDSLAELLGTYQRLRALDILPYRAINHGPTVSFYYADPEGNQIELQVDSFPDAEATNAWMRSEAFRRNPIGIDFDPDDMVRRLAAGVPEAELLRRPDSLD